MYSHFTLTWENSELPKYWNGTPGGGACQSIRMTDILSARTVRLSYCLSGKKCLPAMRCLSVLWTLHEYKHQTSREVHYKSCWSWGRSRLLLSSHKPALQITGHLFMFTRFENWKTGKQKAAVLCEKRRYKICVAPLFLAICILWTAINARV
jgi:hypothetical protein